MNIEKLYELYLNNSNICTDSRNVTPNSLFFALKGDNFDGNEFAQNAIQSGCSFAVVDNVKIAINNKYILVNNVLETLQKLANYHRRKLNIPILAITGTNGKTTTKELLGKVLSQKYNVAITYGNLNNHIGVPLTLLKITREHTFGIIEMGANHEKEINALCKIVEPNFGLITNIGKAHLEGFGSIDGVKRTKGELFEYLQQVGGIVFINIGDSILTTILNKFNSLRTIPFSQALYDVKIKDTNNQNPFLHFSTNIHENIRSSLVGIYNLNNILAAISVGLFMGVSIKQISEAIHSYIPQNNRSQLIQTKNNIIYMDAYNANPSSMEASIKNFSSLNESKKLLILGDMLELGKDSINEHNRIINLINELGFKNVWLIGNNFIISASNPSNITLFKTSNDVINHLKTNPLKEHTILIKGSRSIKLEKILDYL